MLDKKYGIERLKVVGVKEFSGIVEAKWVEKWLKTLEKYFSVMQCPEERKIDLTVFLLKEGAKDW